MAKKDLLDRYGKVRAKNGKHFLSALFWELRYKSQNMTPPYCLGDYDISDDCKSMYLIYMSHDTEYDAAIALLGSWKHWEKLCKSPVFTKHITEWRKEKDLQMLALAKKTLIVEAAAGSVSAAKAIIQESKAVRGRPSKQEINKNLTAERDVDEFLDGAMRIIK